MRRHNLLLLYFEKSLIEKLHVPMRVVDVRVLECLGKLIENEGKYFSYIN